MEIAQVSPLIESVPPRFYGGTERVVSYVTEELIRRGHKVTLFASGDSKTGAELVPVVDTALRLGNLQDPLFYHTLLLEEVAKRRDQFDIIHFHLAFEHFPLARQLAVPQLTTMHGRADIPGLQAVFREFTDMPMVSISDYQRTPIPYANWMATIYHGLPEDLYTYRQTAEHYLAFIGRASPEKGLDRAVEIATGCGIDIKVAAKVDEVDQDYFDARVKPLLDHPHVEYMGEITAAQKDELLGNALAVLFPIEWPEPFGLVMIEAMACGTPVIAFPQGSVPEVISHGETGFIVNNVDEAIKAMDKIHTISRECCRYIFETRFSDKHMTDEYLKIYETLI